MDSEAQAQAGQGGKAMSLKGPEKSCDKCAHQVGWANPEPECELLDDMDCLLNDHLYFEPKADKQEEAQK